MAGERARPAASRGLEPSCLYPDEDEIARLVCPKKRVAEWRGLAAVLERQGFPPVDPEFGGRYWPAVKAFLDARNGVADHGFDRRSSR